jgi:acetyl esterase/lipase
MKKFLKYAFGGLAAVLLLTVAGFWYWAESSLAQPAPAAIAAMQSDGRVAVDDGEYVVFRPATGPSPGPITGLILYPGAACDVRGYAPVLRRIADRGYVVVGVPMPLNMAILAPNRADDVRAAFPEVQRWVIAGHSMGGAMAAHYAHKHPDELAGVILWDSYPAASDTLVDLPVPVWHIHRATAAGRAPEKFERMHNLFPATSTWVPVPGGIHMQFGSFSGGGYQEEWTATISAQEQQDIAVTGTLNALLAMAK